MQTRRGFLTGCSIAGLSLAGCLGFGEEREVLSEYRYMASVNPTATVSNVTIRLPAPATDGEAAFAADLAGDAGIRPTEWSYAVAETDRGPMLEITVDELEPANRPYDLEFSVSADEEIDTREALANEPTLSGRSNRTQADCSFPHPDSWDDRLRCHSYESSFYGEFEPTGTSVAVDASLTGENAWFEGGWTGNDYTDFAHGFVDGTGWATGEGSIREGVGRYR